MYNSPDFVRIASGDPARTHWTTHFLLSSSLATEAFLLRKRQAVSRTNPTIVSGVPIMSGGIGSGRCALHTRATARMPIAIILRTTLSIFRTTLRQVRCSMSGAFAVLWETESFTVFPSRAAILCTFLDGETAYSLDNDGTGARCGRLTLKSTPWQ